MPTAGSQEQGSSCGARLARERVGPLSLPVLKAKGLLEHPRPRKSRTSKWRAAVLIGVYVLMAAHLVQWWWSGRDDGVRTTISPVEPSESMYTLEGGYLNAGFIFFSLALLSTLLFGRFFCGWGCHIVALQDWCSHLMKKAGVHPKPFRSRFLIWGTITMGFYMFFWPTLKRAAILPLLATYGLEAPALLGPGAPFPGFSNHLVVEDFWRTFPAWYISVPFLLVCGFAVVYFLGAKGFCYSACPYGGLFGPLDRLSVGRIVVNDNCEQCGHCTAVCTSNVRVHEEIHDYGMVMDSGCMKCMDCVSVCPNDALSFRFAAPSLFTRRRTDTPKTRDRFDLAWWEDLAIFATAFGLFMGFRGMFNSVPMLMAGGMAGVGAGLAWKLWSMLRSPNVRLQSLQLKLHGRPTLWGVGIASLAVVTIAAGAWGCFVQYHLWRAGVDDYAVKADYDEVFSPNYRPDPAESAKAQKALRHFRISGPFSDAGLGWRHTGGDEVRIAWLQAVRGNLPAAEQHLRAAVRTSRPTGEWINGLVHVRMLRGDSPADIARLYDELLRDRPDLHEARIGAANLALQLGQPARAVDLVRPVLDARPAASTDLEAAAINVLLSADRTQDALAAAKRAVARRPESGILRMSLGTCYAILGMGEQSCAELRNAVDREPKNLLFRSRLAEVLRFLGRDAEAAEQESKIREIAGAGPR